jgi:hypothetical protein
VVELSRRLVQIVPEEVWPQSIDSAIFTARSRNVYQTLERLAELGQNGVDFCLVILKVIVFIGVSRCGADAIRVILAFQLI